MKHALLQAIDLLNSEDSEEINLGFDILKEQAAHDNYQACVNLMWACEKQNEIAPFTLTLHQELLKKIIKLHDKLDSSEDLILAGTLCCQDPKYGWLLPSGELFNFNPDSQRSILENQILFKASQLKGLILLEKAGKLGSIEAFWGMYEYTRYHNPFSFNRLACLEVAADGKHMLALLELADILIKEDPEKALQYIKLASDLGNIEATEWLQKLT